MPASLVLNQKNSIWRRDYFTLGLNFETAKEHPQPPKMFKYKNEDSGLDPSPLFDKSIWSSSVHQRTKKRPRSWAHLLFSGAGVRSDFVLVLFKKCVETFMSAGEH